MLYTHNVKTIMHTQLTGTFYIAFEQDIIFLLTSLLRMCIEIT
jgi:hypothetical protein